MPIKWSQVRKGLDPKAYTMATVPALLKKPDPWADYDAGARPLSEAISRIGGKALKPA
jgi:bifunctional non-homologous end joining protein LigD